ncbi:MAG: amino acid permease, partial [Calditrichaeota bacterium]|nr:amino acid permease [Calditrichota bacterium]
FVMRRRDPGTETYRAWGYPITQLIYLAISAWLMINTLYHRPLEALWGILIVAVGVPFYYGWKKREGEI